MRKVRFIIPLVLMLMLVVGCASETPWRKATVSTFELLGAGIGTTEGVTTVLRSQGAITDAQVLQVKAIYNKAKAAYILAGNSLKLAGKAESAAKRDALLAEYDKLLGDFNVLTQQLYDLIKTFKKVSRYEVEMWVRNGGELWVQ